MNVNFNETQIIVAGIVLGCIIIFAVVLLLRPKTISVADTSFVAENSNVTEDTVDKSNHDDDPEPIRRNVILPDVLRDDFGNILTTARIEGMYDAQGWPRRGVGEAVKNPSQKEVNGIVNTKKWPKGGEAVGGKRRRRGSRKTRRSIRRRYKK